MRPSFLAAKGDFSSHIIFLTLFSWSDWPGDSFLQNTLVFLMYAQFNIYIFDKGKFILISE